MSIVHEYGGSLYAFDPSEVRSVFKTRSSVSGMHCLDVTLISGEILSLYCVDEEEMLHVFGEIKKGLKS